MQSSCNKWIKNKHTARNLEPDSGAAGTTPVSDHVFNIRELTNPASRGSISFNDGSGSLAAVSARAYKIPFWFLFGLEKLLKVVSANCQRNLGQLCQFTLDSFRCFSRDISPSSSTYLYIFCTRPIHHSIHFNGPEIVSQFYTRFFSVVVGSRFFESSRFSILFALTL